MSTLTTAQEVTHTWTVQDVLVLIAGVIATIALWIAYVRSIGKGRDDS